MLTGLRDWIRKNRLSRNPFARSVSLLLSLPRYLWRFLTDGYWRSILFQRLRRRGGVHLPCNFTKLDRYPEVFSLVRRHLEAQELADSPELRLLSFGCATGEEAFTLRRYFPHATIIGADVSRWSLRRARARNRDERIRFVLSKPTTLDAEGPFHAIFAMAVLLRVAHPAAPAESLATSYPFEQFEAQLLQLDATLAVGGALAIQHTNYHVLEASIAERYQALPFAFSEPASVPKFDHAGRRTAETGEVDRVFVKRQSKDAPRA